jgi:hypothetical protein
MVSGLQILGVNSPPDFPATLFQEIESKVKELRHEGLLEKENWSEFAQGWNGVGYRFLFLCDYDKDFSSVSRQTDHTELYKQNKALFGFFSSASSLFENYAYCLYLLGNSLRSSDFPTDEKSLKNVYFNTIASKYSHIFPGEAVTNVLSSIESRHYFEAINEIRKVGFHRGNPSRKYYQGGDKSGQVELQARGKTYRIDENPTQDIRKQIASDLEKLMRGTSAFIDDNFASLAK